MVTAYYKVEGLCKKTEDTMNLDKHEDWICSTASAIIQNFIAYTGITFFIKLYFGFI